MIIDNFLESFSDLEKSDIINARSEAEKLSEQSCNTAEQKELSVRCDNVMWLKNLDTNGENMPAFGKIAQAMKLLRPVFNKFSQAESGDSKLSVDYEEFVLTRFNGASEKDQKYERHKDSYVHEQNNEIHDTSLRKLSMVMFLNDDLDHVYTLPGAKKGMLRLYPKGESEEKVVDISPRLGRVVLFKSEEMLHEVMSSHKWDNYALTVYFNQIVDKPLKQHPIPDDWKIFVSIASYRDN